MDKTGDAEKPMDLLSAMELERDIPHPFAGIQWKGTDVCMDVHCDCGAHYHIDGDFVYFVKCGHCGRTFCCGTRIELIEMGVGALDDGNVSIGEVWALDDLDDDKEG